MKKHAFAILALGILAFGVTGCSLFGTNGTTDQSSSSSAPALSETAVTYQGTIEQLVGSGTTEGTHRLSLGDGEYLQLQSDVVNLDDYVGQSVRVTGMVRSLLDNSGRIMRVTNVAAILEDSSASVSVPDIGIPLMSSSSSEPQAASSAPQAVSSPKPVAVSSKAVFPPPPPPPPLPTDGGVPSAVSSRATVMAHVKADPSQWTQQYCSSHIGFCIPVHKNWWFKSFGVTTSALWHVEISSEDIQTLGDGPIVLTFLSGGLPSGATDSSVVANGDTVTGYRAWAGQRHFEISAPASLKASVTYITENLATYEAPAEASSSSL